MRCGEGVLDRARALAPEVGCSRRQARLLTISIGTEGNELFAWTEPVSQADDVVIDLDRAVAIALGILTVHRRLQTFFSLGAWRCPPFALLYLWISPNLSQLANNEPC
jgi:hypothetical protein